MIFHSDYESRLFEISALDSRYLFAGCGVEIPSTTLEVEAG